MLPELSARTDMETAAGAQMRRSKTGPALALKTYLEKPNAQRLEWLTRAVLIPFRYVDGIIGICQRYTTHR
jgi:hypothetical protein